MNGVELAFVLLGAVALGAGFLVVTTSRIVHAALWLAVCLGAIAGCFLLLTAELLAWVQVLIYVGAVVVLVLFALMLTRAPIGPTPGASRGRVVVAATVAVATGVVLLVTLLAGLGGEVIDLEAVDVGGARGRRFGALPCLGPPVRGCCRCCCLQPWSGAIVLSRGRGDEDGR